MESYLVNDLYLSKSTALDNVYNFDKLYGKNANLYHFHAGAFDYQYPFVGVEITPDEDLNGGIAYVYSNFKGKKIIISNIK